MLTYLIGFVGIWLTLDWVRRRGVRKRAIVIADRAATDHLALLNEQLEKALTDKAKLIKMLNWYVVNFDKVVTQRDKYAQWVAEIETKRLFYLAGPTNKIQ